jgi:hypothetical protein
MASVVYFVKDLLFSSKIRETANQVGLDVEPFRDPKELALAARSAKVVIVDLRLKDALEVLELISADPESQGVLSVGFIDHEKEDVMEAAVKRGCKRVLAKGRFSTELPLLLSGLS